MLARFRKSGGFLQLVQLVETTDPRRRQNLIELIAKEDPGWAQLVRLKVLTKDRILNWEPRFLMQIWPQIPLPIIKTIWLKSTTAQRERIERSIPRAFQTTFRKSVDAGETVDDVEEAAASLRLVAIVREMNLHGLLDFNDIDPGLTWDPAMVENLEPFKAA